jgi:hypothetical protein
MLKLISKFTMDILPSVIATIIGAYIVNHYINIKPGADASATAAAVSSVDPKKATSKGGSRPVEKSADLGNIPEPGVRAKGISETNPPSRNPPTRLTSLRRPQVSPRLLPQALRWTPAGTSRRRVKRPPPGPLPQRFHRSPPNRWLPHQIPFRRLKPRSLRMPTIWRARRSSGCAARLRLRRVPRKRPAKRCAFRRRLVSWLRPFPHR